MSFILGIILFAALSLSDGPRTRATVDAAGAPVRVKIKAIAVNCLFDFLFACVIALASRCYITMGLQNYLRWIALLFFIAFALYLVMKNLVRPSSYVLVKVSSDDITKYSFLNFGIWFDVVVPCGIFAGSRIGTMPGVGLMTLGYVSCSIIWNSILIVRPQNVDMHSFWSICLYIGLCSNILIIYILWFGS